MSIERAREAVAEFLTDMFGNDAPDYVLIEDGETNWAWWILDTDTTSYVHSSDYTIEWYGTSWEPDNA